MNGICWRSGSGKWNVVTGSKDGSSFIYLLFRFNFYFLFCFFFWNYFWVRIRIRLSCNFVFFMKTARNCLLKCHRLLQMAATLYERENCIPEQVNVIQHIIAGSSQLPLLAFRTVLSWPEPQSADHTPHWHQPRTVSSPPRALGRGLRHCPSAPVYCGIKIQYFLGQIIWETLNFQGFKHRLVLDYVHTSTS